MHELSICVALMEQVEAIAKAEGAEQVTEVVLQIGPLSGVEPELLQHAFPIACADTVAEDAALIIEPQPVKVRCLHCSAETETTPSRLVCSACGALETTLISGDEMILARVVLESRDDRVESN
ncbi:MAG: hydrogenase maturation nickel metallochaperone HypA [Pseudomonadota bacterium]